jgi:hypothetical protein
MPPHEAISEAPVTGRNIQYQIHERIRMKAQEANIAALTGSKGINLVPKVRQGASLPPVRAVLSRLGEVLCNSTYGQQ